MPDGRMLKFWRAPSCKARFWPEEEADQDQQIDQALPDSQ
jgi:hypothetical protein